MHMKAGSCFALRPPSFQVSSSICTSAHCSVVATRHRLMCSTSRLMPHLFLSFFKKTHLVYLFDLEALCYYFLLKFLFVGSISEFSGPQRQPLPERWM